MNTKIERKERLCGWAPCGKQFRPSGRSGRYRQHGRSHEGAVYCSPACRQATYRWRRASTSVTNRTGVRTSVTPPKIYQSNQYAAGAKIEGGRPTFSLPAGYVFSDWKPSWQPHWPQPTDDLSISDPAPSSIV